MLENQNLIMTTTSLPPFSLLFIAPNSFSMVWSKDCTNDVRWPIVADNTSHDTPPQPWSRPLPFRVR